MIEEIRNKVHNIELVIDDIKKITKCEVNPVIALFSEIKEAISNCYVQEPVESIEEIIEGESVESIKYIKDEKKEIT